MSGTQVIKARLQQKINTAEYWNNHASFIPLEGEEIYYVFPVDSTEDPQYSGSSKDSVHVRKKIGDGKTTVGSLNFLENWLVDLLDEEIARATAVETALSSTATANYNTLIQKINDEYNRATQAELSLSNNLDHEANLREEADKDLQDNIEKEQAAREAADTSLQSGLNTEANTRSTKDTELQANIDAEITRAKAAEAAEQAARINRDTELNTKIEQEISDRAAAINSAITALDYTNTGADGKYIKYIGQADGVINPTLQEFDKTISSSSTDNNAPTSKAVNTVITNTKNTLTTDIVTAVNNATNHFEGEQLTTDTSESTAITRITSGKAVYKGNTLILKTLIADDKYSYKAFVYTDKWEAMDGNYDANNVYLNEDIKLAGNYTQVGNLTKTQNGTATFATAGKSIKEALTEMLSQRLQPTAPTQPAVSITFSQAGSYEVGTRITPSYSASLSAGSYTYGPATGIAATAWDVKDTKSGTATTASGNFAAFTVADGESYSITATATHGQGAIADDNLGSDSNPIVRIAAGTKSRTSGTVSGYRSYFYGVLSTSSTNTPLTSAIIRSLTKGGAYNGSKTFTINANSTAKRIVVAIPGNSSRSGLKEVILTSAMNTPITDSYTKIEDAVSVAGVNSYTSILYDVYVYEPAAIDAGEVHKITLA